MAMKNILSILFLILSLISVHSATIGTNTVPQRMSVYNADVGLRKWFGRIGAASTSIVHVVVIGNSHAEGYGTTDTNKMPYASIIREALQSRFGNAGYGIVPVFRGAGPVSPYGIFTGASWATTGNGQGPFGIDYNANSLAQWDVGLFCDSITLYTTINGTSIGTNAGANSAYILIDGAGGLSNQVNSVGIANGLTYQNTNVSCGPLGMHNVRLYAPNHGTAKWIGFWGIGANIGSSGVQVHNFGRNGTKASDTAGITAISSFASLGANGAVATGGPALSIVEFTSNDYSSQANTNTYIADMMRIVNSLGTNGSVIVIGDNLREGGALTINQSVYHSMLRAAAFTNPTPFCFIDFKEYYAGQDSTIGITVDNIHFNNRGHQHVAQTLLNLVLPMGASPAVKKTSATNNFVLNQHYTNQESAAYISASVDCPGGSTQVSLWLDQDGDGVIERSGITATNSQTLSAFIQPYARFIFTNVSGSPVIRANSSQYFFSK